MSLRHFTGESYPPATRDAAWQEVLAALGLRSTPLPGQAGGQATAAIRGSEDHVLVARLTAGPQALSPLGQKADLPLVLLPLDAPAVLKAGSESRPVEAGDVVLLPYRSGWQLVFAANVRALVFAVSAVGLGGRRFNPCDEPRVLARAGLSRVIGAVLAAVGENFETLTATGWAAVDSALSEFLLTVLTGPNDGKPAAGGTSNQAALLHRLCQSIERWLGDPSLSPLRVAQSQGISERYLQKLFEGTGESFSHYLRERRLQRARADLATAEEARRTINEIAFRRGFNDAAHFSRAFRDRFGVSPRDFREREASRATEQTARHGQRGWPRAALSHLGAQPPDCPTGTDADLAEVDSRAAPATVSHHRLEVSADTVHWGYFSRALKPVIEIASGDRITVETLTHHASDDPARMIAGDPGAESVFRWTAEDKAVDRRGAGPMDASVYGRGPGEGFGVHICTGPVMVKGAEPGDVLEVRLLDIAPRASRAPGFENRVFGSSVAAHWGYHYNELLAEPKPREVVTIYELVRDAAKPYLQAVKTFRWTPQTDPSGRMHRTYDYPGVPVDAATIEPRATVLEGIRIPYRPFFGVIALAPRESELVDSVPPAYFGGNFDNWRLTAGTAVYLPVSTPGALLSIGDPHAAQGDGEVSGTAIECSMTGTFEVILHRRHTLAGWPFDDLSAPLIETKTAWVFTGLSHPDYLSEFGAKGQSEVYARSSLDLAMRDAFRKVRRFLMNAHGLDEDETIALMSAAVDFGVTQVVDGNWGVHAIVRKSLFAGRTRKPEGSSCNST